VAAIRYSQGASSLFPLRENLAIEQFCRITEWANKGAGHPMSLILIAFMLPTKSLLSGYRRANATGQSSVQTRLSESVQVVKFETFCRTCVFDHDEFPAPDRQKVIESSKESSRMPHTDKIDWERQACPGKPHLHGHFPLSLSANL